MAAIFSDPLLSIYFQRYDMEDSLKSERENQERPSDPSADFLNFSLREMHSIHK